MSAGGLNGFDKVDLANGFPLMALKGLSLLALKGFSDFGSPNGFDGLV